MLYAVVRAVRYLPVRPLAAAAVLLALARVTAGSPRLGVVHGHARDAGLAWLALVVGWWVLRWLAPQVSTRASVRRRDAADRVGGGLATWTEVGQHAGKTAMRARARLLRPAARAARSRWGRWLFRWTFPVTGYAVPLIRTSWLPFGSTVWSSCEDVTLRIGGPRSGKSGSLACHALDAPGALLVTTTRRNLLDGTRAARAARGRVDVFNPTGIGDVPSTVRWSPLAGCTDYSTAVRRAGDLIPDGSTSSDAERWDEQARGLLTTLLYAAALAGGSMRTVLRWVSPADTIARDEILNILRTARDRYPHGAPHRLPDGTTRMVPLPDSLTLIDHIRMVYATNDRTLTSITATLLPRLRWVNDPAIAQVADADLADPDFLDLAALVAGGTDSLYLLGETRHTATVLGALTAEVAHQVRMHAERQPGGRLEPPMVALLDEAPLTCGPIPLHRWTADMGGRNFTLHLVAQSLAQLRDELGPHRAAAVLANTGALLVFGNIKSDDDLQETSTLCGIRMVDLDADDTRPLPVFTPADISRLQPGQALVLRNGMRPALGHAPMLWDRPRHTLGNILTVAAAKTATALRRARTHLTAATTPAPAGAPAGASAGASGAEPAGARTAHAAGQTAPAGRAGRTARAAAVRAQIEDLFARPGLDLDDPTHTGQPTNQTTDGHSTPAAGAADSTSPGTGSDVEGGAA